MATSTPELLDELCASLKETLEEVCTGTCEKQTYDCTGEPQNNEDDLIDATLPGMIAFDLGDDEDSDPEVESSPSDKSNVTTEKPESTTSGLENAPSSSITDKSQPVGEFSLRKAVDKEPAESVNYNAIVNNPSEESSTSTSAPDVKIGAKTSETKTGGVDKSVIGIIVAGMIIVVAVITIKKNWSSISKRFGSSPRPPNNRTDATANGATPEEVPLQDKSPV